MLRRQNRGGARVLPRWGREKVLGRQVPGDGGLHCQAFLVTLGGAISRRQEIRRVKHGKKKNKKRKTKKPQEVVVLKKKQRGTGGESPQRPRKIHVDFEEVN